MRKEIKMDDCIKCHKCRNILLKDCPKHVIDTFECDPQKCGTFNEKQFIFLSEDQLPSWIKMKIMKEQWTKGKLHCESCGSKVGSFDYISGRRCNCGSSIIPSVHLITSQIDRPLNIVIQTGT